MIDWISLPSSLPTFTDNNVMDLREDVEDSPECYPVYTFDASGTDEAHDYQNRVLLSYILELSARARFSTDADIEWEISFERRIICLQAGLGDE